ncbi:MAG TPA: glutathione transferase GstA [Azospirillaceae bacterium]|nr:glutathione transferase GstA [Azospirillaceae bacterium]
MKLYYTPGACSLASHIALREAGIGFDLARVDHATKTTEEGEDFLAVNPNGYVPALRMAEGGVLTEGAAILQYIADKAPAAGLAPAAGTTERYRLLEWLTFISTELHKNFGPLFNPAAPEAYKDIAKASLAKRLAHVDRHLAAAGPYLLGERFSIADAYLFTVSGWALYHKLDLTPYPALLAYRARVAARAAVQEALKAEGLLKAA